MAKLKIVWHSTAYDRYSSIIAWKEIHIIDLKPTNTIR